MLAAALILRGQLINAARDHMQKSDIHWFQILGTRIPCEGLFDVGVGVNYQEHKEAKRSQSGRLCRSLGSDDWAWHPDRTD